MKRPGDSFVYMVLQREREREREGGRERERVLSVIRCNNNPVHLQWVCRRRQTEKEGNKMQHSVRRTSPC